MKSKFTWVGIIATLLVVLTTFFVACKKDDMNEVVKYHGQVVYINTTTPFANLTVKVTNGSDTHCQTQTDGGGMFSLTVRVSEIDGSYYLLVGDASCVQKQIPLSGYGQSEVGLGTIEIEGPSMPTVTTKAITNISDNKATSGGNVTSDGRSPVSARGVCWAKNEYPTVDGDHTENGTGLGEFTSQLTGLEPGAIYYVRAYATNKMGTAYGDQLMLSTMTGLPTVTTDEVTKITATTATCGGNVAAGSGYQITARGICWSNRTASPTISNDHTEEVATTGKFTSMMIDLERGTTYYVRAYATNEKGTNYGETKIFTTLSGMPKVTTAQVSDVTSTTAKCGGDVTDNGGYRITARGVCWSSTSSTPSVEDDHTSEVADNGAFTSLMTGLNLSTTYYVRAYATNEVGTSYGETVIFTTTDGLPVVQTGIVSNITATSADINATVVSPGDSQLTACGVCWSNTKSSPTVEDDHTEDVPKVGVFSTKMTNLVGMQTYYVRAYATNLNGTVYGEAVSFFTASTADGLPIVTTLDPGENITTTSVVTGGNVTNDGGFPVTECGVVYGTLPSPTLSNSSKVVGGKGTGYFSAIITGVSPAKYTYYIRAYATNQNGTAYGEQITITPERSEYLSLLSMTYGGYTYRVKFLGEMSWYDGAEICSKTVIGGFSDWYMPDNAEVQAIIAAYGLWKTYIYTTSNTALRMDGCTDIWAQTSSSSSSSAYYYYLKDDGGSDYRWSWALSTSTAYKSNLKGVYAVRKYKVNQ